MKHQLKGQDIEANGGQSRSDWLDNLHSIDGFDICEKANKPCTVAEALVEPKQKFSFQSSFKVYQLVRLPLTKLVDTTSYVHRYYCALAYMGIHSSKAALLDEFGAQQQPCT